MISKRDSNDRFMVLMNCRYEDDENEKIYNNYG